MKRKIELLAPGGDVDSIKAAIVAGADAVYCGLNSFNARNRATNIEFDDLNGILNLAHRHGCKIFLTVNIIIVEREISSLVNLLNKLINTSIDGIIVQDLGLFYILSKYFKGLPIHASTQLTTHNEGQISFLSQLNATRVNLSRELNIDEIKGLTSIAHENDTAIEVFVHGSNCISFSGICYISSVLEGKSGNRGRCSQPCRDSYLTTPEGKNFPLNLKDNSAYANLRDLYDAGVDSIKIEGRIKKFHYVYTVVDTWKKHLDDLYNQKTLSNDNSALYRVFNRDFSNSFLNGEINKDMYIDNPRDNSAIHLAEKKGCTTDEGIERAKQELHDERTGIIAHVRKKIAPVSIEKPPLTIGFSGEAGTPLSLRVRTPDRSFVVTSETQLVPGGTNSLTFESLRERFKPLNKTEYRLQDLDLQNLEAGLFIPFKELSSIRHKVISRLNGERENVAPIRLSSLKNRADIETEPELAVLISSPEHLQQCAVTSARTFFQLPGCFKQDYSEYIELFTQNPELVPWFPSVLIGKDYLAAVDILRRVRPELIVTNNNGIAYEAYQNGIPWVAGPYLNIVNSFSILCLKEQFNCHGSFLSNELSKQQLKGISNPGNFKFYYSIYHPILLLTSRQCLHHQTVGCGKEIIDEECLTECDKSSAITNSKGVPLFIDKTRGDYHSVYNNNNFMNADIVADLPGIFSGFLLDLREVETGTEIESDRPGIIKAFEELLGGNPNAKGELERMIHPSTNGQYRKGI